jgi:hypothetical protein
MTINTRGLLLGAVAVCLALTTIVVPVAAQAANPTPLAKPFKAWTAWQSTDANGIICYISAIPKDSKPDGVNRDPIHFLVIHRKGLGTKNEVQTLIGYPFNSTNANASAAIDGKVFPMVTEGSAAWLAAAKDEGNFVAAMKAGTVLVVKGTSQRGTNTVDTYDLGGVTAAMGEIDKACI